MICHKIQPTNQPNNIECKARRHQVSFFEFLVWLDLGLNPSFPDHWRTLLPLSLSAYLLIAGRFCLECTHVLDCLFQSWHLSEYRTSSLLLNFCWCFQCDLFVTHFHEQVSQYYRKTWLTHTYKQKFYRKYTIYKSSIENIYLSWCFHDYFHQNKRIFWNYCLQKCI